MVQLILTIGKARTFDKVLPPPFFGAFDAEKIAFLPYNAIQEVFYQNDFNWNVAPSNHETKEFKQVYDKVKTTIENETLLFYYQKDDSELREFIKTNFVVGKFGLTKTRIDKNNFITIYNKWLAAVKPTIAVNWEVARSVGIIDGDFFLADLLAADNETLREKLYVVLRKNHYELDRTVNEIGLFNSSKTSFTDKQVAHTQFWNRYERPPQEQYWEYIINRRDLLVPQDVRERKGSFFTPQIWVELSQEYLAKVLGEDWQDEYYIWDCAAGTGNLLAGLTNKYNIWASTLDRQDVDVMKDRIQNGTNLLESHVFQFDFLNDDFKKLPKSLQEIINSPEKRKKLVVYINPPYAEHGNRTTIGATGKHKSKVATTSKVYDSFNPIVGTATRELFAQFFLRVYKEMPDVRLASFCTVKFVNSQNFSKFRQYFKAKYEKGFMCKANSFDNVKGQFPISFLIWDLSAKNEIVKIDVDMIEETPVSKTKPLQKSFYAMEKINSISNWLRKFYDKKGEKIGYIILPGVDMQQQGGVYFTSEPTESDIKQHKTALITKNNVIPMAIYLAVRHAVKHTWLNNQDQFLYPHDAWQQDVEFQNNCLAFSLFYGKNMISAAHTINHWLPFTEYEINAKEKFASNFMSQFMAGKLKYDNKEALFEATMSLPQAPLIFSDEAQTVFATGKLLWIYYHKQPNCNSNASFYDIKVYFQGRNAAGKMNNKSTDETYNELIGNLREALQVLGEKIAEKVYEHGFLKR